jgi:ABC-type phosphate transport system substrate-binding protein
MNKIKSLLAIVFLCAPIHLIGGEGNAIIIFSNYDLNKTIFMNKTAIQRIFTRKETHWSNGDNITVFIKPIDSIEHRNFVTNVLNMTMYRYQQSLENITYTAAATPVIEVSSDVKMMNAIHTHPGSIGYVNYDLVVNDKIIKICDDNTGCI